MGEAHITEFNKTGENFENYWYQIVQLHIGTYPNLPNLVNSQLYYDRRYVFFCFFFFVEAIIRDDFNHWRRVLSAFLMIFYKCTQSVFFKVFAFSVMNTSTCFVYLVFSNCN